MTDNKSKAKNTAVYPIRISPELRKAFTRACDSMDSNGSREIRKFMREFVAAHGQTELDL